MTTNSMVQIRLDLTKTSILHLSLPNYWWKNCFSYAFARKLPMKWLKSDQFFPNSHQNPRRSEFCSNGRSVLPQMKGATLVWSARRGGIYGEWFFYRTTLATSVSPATHTCTTQIPWATSSGTVTWLRPDCKSRSMV
ncbi:MAG: hypothetical protein RLZZ519_2441 [Bacteroidota bacterium]